MMKLWLTLMCSVQDPSLPPAPKFVVVHDTIPKDGTIVLHPRKMYMERKPIKRFINVNGRVMEQVIYSSYGVQKHDTLDARDSCVITPDGMQLRIDEVWKRLKPNTVLLVSADANRPAPEYLRALSPDTLIFIPAAPAKK